MGISYSLLWPDLMRLERLHTPPTLTHPCTHTSTHTAPLDKGGSRKSSHLTWYWSSRAVGMEKEGSPPTQAADLPGQKDNMREAFRETCCDGQGLSFHKPEHKPHSRGILRLLWGAWKQISRQVKKNKPTSVSYHIFHETSWCKQMEHH